MKYILLNAVILQNAMRELSQCLELGEVYQCEIKPYRKTRSNSQNALMWLWLDEIRKHVYDSTGQAYSSEELHEVFKQRFLPTTQVQLAGKLAWVPMSTTRLTTGQMTEYLNKIEAYAATELGCDLPHPMGLYEVANGRGMGTGEKDLHRYD